MILKQLKLSNIRSYDNETINFNQNITLLSGDIGCGKSSILLAIEFSLFGFVKGTVNGDMLLRKGCTSGFAELTFQIDDQLITIKRTLKKTSKDIQQGPGSITINNSTQDYTATELKDRILNILGYPKSLLKTSKDLIFRYTVYTPQELMKQILFEDSEQRLNSLRKVFDIQKYKTIKDNLNIANSLFRQQITYLKNITKDLTDVESKIKELEEHKIKTDKDIEIINSRLNNLRKELETDQTIKKDFDNKIKEINEKKKLIHSHEELIRTKELQNSELKTSIDKYDINLNEIKTKLLKDIPKTIDETEIQNKILELSKSVNEHISKKNILENNIKVFQLNFNDLNKRIIELRRSLMKKTEILNSIEEITKKIESYRDVKEKLDDMIKQKHLASARIYQLNSEIEKSKQKAEKINELTNCPTCKQDVSDMHKEDIKNKELELINKYKKEIFDLKQKSNQFVDDINILNKQHEEFLHNKNKLVELNLEMKDIDKKQKEYDGAFLNLNESKNNIEKIKKELDIENQTDIEKIKHELEEHKNKLIEAKKINAIIAEQKTLNTKIESMNKLIKQYLEIIDKNNLSTEESKKIMLRLKEEISNIDVSKLEELDKEIELLKSQIHQNEINLNVNKNELNNIRKNLLEYNNKLKIILEHKSRLDHFEKTKDWINKDFVELIDIIEKQTMSYVNQQFNEYFQTWFEMLMDNDINAHIDENFSVIVNVDGYDYALESLSGGEKTAIALAYRLALNQVINSIQMKIKTKDLLILDEPTDGFSKEQLDRVRDIIKNANAKQIIIVSHEALLESFANYIIKIEKINGKSKVFS